MLVHGNTHIESAGGGISIYRLRTPVAVAATPSASYLFLRLATTLVVLFLCATAAFAESDKTTLRKMWASSRYAANPVPAAWRPAEIPASESDVRAFEKFSLKTEERSIQKFIARFGLPSRYVTAKRAGGQGFLIYDLPSGHAVALYVYDPPNDVFGACVIITSDGSLVRMIK